MLIVTLDQGQTCTSGLWEGESETEVRQGRGFLPYSTYIQQDPWGPLILCQRGGPGPGKHLVAPGKLGPDRQKAEGLVTGNTAVLLVSCSR